MFRAKARRGGSTVSLLRHGRLGCRGEIDCALGPKHGWSNNKTKKCAYVYSRADIDDYTSARRTVAGHVAGHVADVAVEWQMMRP